MCRERIVCLRDGCGGRSHYFFLQRQRAHTMTQNTNPIEIILPRSTYYHGETLTGLIHSSHTLKVLIIGKCRIDARWYNTKNLLDFYGTHPVLQQLSQQERNLINNTEDTICFYATNIIEFDTEKNHVFGSYLNYDLPHSSTFRSCRYYYEVIALSKDDTTHSSLSFKIHSCIQSIQNNPTILNHNTQQKAILQSGGAAARLKIGSCFIIDTFALSNLSKAPSKEANSHKDIKTIRISNENTPYCILTILNSIMHPGSTMHLQFHLLHKIKQIQCSIKGVEYTFYDDTKTCKTTKKYILDSVVRSVHEETFVGMLMCLPKIDCPCSISTDLVELGIFCSIELIVDENANAKDEEKKLSFQFPVHVVHDSKVFHEEDDDRGEVLLDLNDDDSNYELILNENVDKELNVNDSIVRDDLLVLDSYLRENA